MPFERIGVTGSMIESRFAGRRIGGYFNSSLEAL